MTHSSSDREDNDSDDGKKKRDLDKNEDGDRRRPDGDRMEKRRFEDDRRPKGRDFLDRPDKKFRSENRKHPYEDRRNHRKMRF
jgi:hypothetical protein